LETVSKKNIQINLICLDVTLQPWTAKTLKVQPQEDASAVFYFKSLLSLERIGKFKEKIYFVSIRKKEYRNLNLING
jgi:hypothetical protein